jgi:hypothetical protein
LIRIWLIPVLHHLYSFVWFMIDLAGDHTERRASATARSSRTVSFRFCLLPEAR